MEVSFQKPKYTTRCFAFLFDFMCMAITACVLILAAMNIMNNVPYYKAANAKIDSIHEASHMYVKRNDGSFKLMCDHYVPMDEKQMKEYNSEFDQALIAFYSDPMFFDQEDPKSGITLYNLQKIPENGQSDLFTYASSSHQTIVEKPGAKTEDLYEFYVNAMSGKAVQYMTDNHEYIHATKTVSLSYIFIILLLPIVLSTTIFEYIIPICLRRGKKTLGKLVFKLSVVDVHGLSCGAGRYTLRFLILLFIEVLLSIVAVAIPFIVSFSMFAFSKTSQSFHDYVVNTYVIEAPMKSVCLTADEYKKKYEKESQFVLDKDEVAL